MAVSYDLGGNNLIVNELFTGATAPGQAGTELTGANLAVLASASSANNTTGKAAILGTSGAVTFAGAVTPTGGVASAGGFTSSARNMHTGGNPASVSTDFSDATPSTTETYYSEVFVPANVTLTGVALFNGSNVTGNVTVYLTNSAGTNLAHSASTAGSGTDAYQRVPFTATYAAVGPATYYVVAQYSSATARYNAHTIGNFGTGKDTATTYGTFPTTPTIPTTFTTALGNVASLY